MSSSASIAYLHMHLWVIQNLKVSCSWGSTKSPGNELVVSVLQSITKVSFPDYLVANHSVIRDNPCLHCPQFSSRLINPCAAISGCTSDTAESTTPLIKGPHRTYALFRWVLRTTSWPNNTRFRSQILFSKLTPHFSVISRVVKRSGGKDEAALLPP